MMYLRILLILLTCITIARAGDVSTWDSTAANNNSAPPNGFPEGMAPSAVNNAAREVMAAVRRQHENDGWRDYGHTVAFASATSFTVNSSHGDQTAEYKTGRRIKIEDLTTLYGEITSSSFSVSTTVNVKLDSGSISASISSVELADDQLTNDQDAAQTDTVNTFDLVQTFSEAPAFVKAPTASVPIYIDPGLRPILSNNATDADHDIDVTVGAIANSTGRYVLEATAAIGKQLDVVWASGGTPGTPTGGRATGFTLPATDRSTVHVHLLGRTDGASVNMCFDDEVDAADCLADANVVAAGYTLFRRIGSLIIDATDDFYIFAQRGDKFYIEPYLFIDSALTIGATFGDHQAGGPQGLEGLELLIINNFGNSGASNRLIQAGYGASDFLVLNIGWVPATNGGSYDNHWIPVKSDGNIRLRYQVASPSTTFLFNGGWTDRLDLD